jgi:hypothetical protein
MKELWAAIYVALTGDAALLLLTGHGATPHISRAKQGERIALPCVVFGTTAVEPGGDGAEHQHHRVAVHCYATDEPTVADMAQRVMLVLHGEPLAAANVRVTMCYHEMSGALDWDESNQCYAQDIFFLAGAIN